MNGSENVTEDLVLAKIVETILVSNCLSYECRRAIITKDGLENASKQIVEYLKEELTDELA